MLARWWGPFAGPLVALVSFVCSVGNVPLAAVLWQHGLSFGGVIAFLFGDLIILPIVNIHRKYYGWRAALLLLVLFYAAMAGAALMVEWIFLLSHLTPDAHAARMTMEMVFPLGPYGRPEYRLSLRLITVLLWRFFTAPAVRVCCGI